jgi:hypothetical protein
MYHCYMVNEQEQTMKEFVAMVTPRTGGTEAVTIKGCSVEHVTSKLLEMGYLEVHWVL